MTSPAAITYGPIFIGVMFNILLYGIMITQTFLYFTAYKRDKLWMKLFVCLLFLCDTLNCAFDITFLYVPLVNNFGNMQSLTYATWVFATAYMRSLTHPTVSRSLPGPVMTAIIACLVQMFFTWRVYILSGSIPVVAFISFCSLCQLCGGLGTSIAVGMIPEFVHFRNFEVIVIIWLACSAVADSVITIALVWHLRRHKTGFSVTDDVVNRIIRLTVHTGLVTALCATIDLILFLAMPAGLHLIFNLPLSKLYTNSLMSTLNSRAILKYGASDNTSGSNQIRAEKGLNMRADQGNGRISGGQQVFIDVESHEMVDTMDTKKRPSFAASAMPHMANLENLNVANTKEATM